LSTDGLERLRNTLRNQPILLVNKDARLATNLFLANPSEITYKKNCAAIMRHFPGTDLPTYYRADVLWRILPAWNQLCTTCASIYASHTQALLGLFTVPYYGYGRIFYGLKRVFPAQTRTVHQFPVNSNGTVREIKRPYYG
jgi:hypothetical protein